MSTPSPDASTPSTRGVPRARLRAATRRVPRTRVGTGGAADGSNAAEPEPNMKLSRAIAVMLLLHIVAVGGVIAFSLIKEHAPKAKERHAADRNSRANAGAALSADNNSPETGGTVTAETEKNTAKNSPRGSRQEGYIVRPGETINRIANDHGVSVEALVAANGGAQFAAARPRPGQEIKLPEKTSASVPAATPGSAGSAGTKQPSTSAKSQGYALQFIEDAGHGDASGSGASAADVSEKTYTVGKGETASSIAKKYKISYDALLRANGIDDPKKIHIGQKLRIPTKK